MIRLFAGDLDGTLLNNDSKLDKETIKAIKTFQEQGGIFMIATGRNSWELSDVTDHIPDVICNCVNGAQLCDGQGREIISHPVDERDIRNFEKLAEENQYIVLYHGEENRFCNLSEEELRKKCVNYLVWTENLSVANANEFFDLVFNMDGRTVYSAGLSQILSSRILKLEVLFISKEQYQTEKMIFRKEFPGLSLACSTFFNNVEITAPDAEKGKLIKEYCRIMDIEEDEVAVIGDSGNDIGMLHGFKNSYAMGNADREVKHAAKHVTEDNQHHGAALVLKEICKRNREEIDAKDNH